MNDNEILNLVKEKQEELQAATNSLQQIITENPDVFERYTELVEIYNHSWDAVKNLLKGLETGSPVRVGPFSRDQKTSSIKYYANKLPQNVITIPGVVKDVDEKRIIELIATGAIEQHEVEAASYEYFRTPSVRTPFKRAVLPTLVSK